MAFRLSYCWLYAREDIAIIISNFETELPTSWSERSGAG
jgi:hypothetical protein